MDWVDEVENKGSRSDARGPGGSQPPSQQQDEHNQQQKQDKSAAYVPPHLRNRPQGSNNEAINEPTRLNSGGGRRGGRPESNDGFGSFNGRGRGSRRWEKNPFEEEAESKGPGESAEESTAIDFEAYEDIPVEVTGKDPPAGMDTFDDFDLGREINENIKKCKYSKPTPVQKYALPFALYGRDLMACAQTGSGKTAAFGLPIIAGVHRSGAEGVMLDRAAYPLALILSPTRELTSQIHFECRKFSYRTGIRPVVIYGGAPAKEQRMEISRGVEVLIATPGRLVDFMDRGSLKLSRCMFLALDEADRMLDMGFEQQIREIVQHRDLTPVEERQTLMFSATFPDQIQRFARDFLRQDYLFLSVGRVGSSTNLIEQHVEYVRSNEKTDYLIDMLYNGEGLTLVFVERKAGADQLEARLCEKGFKATSIHGDRVQEERESALNTFKKGKTPVMVATDVAARGLDIPNVSHVINYDLPGDIDDYTHRIGRTGRAGKKGNATALFSDRDLNLAPKLMELMDESNQEVPGWLRSLAANVGNSRGRGRGGRFGGRDVRKEGRGRGGFQWSGGGFNGGSSSGRQQASSAWD